MQSSSFLIQKSLRNHAQTIATPGSVREGEVVPQTELKSEVRATLDREKK
jgi:hypothetical protein